MSNTTKYVREKPHLIPNSKPYKRKLYKNQARDITLLKMELQKTRFLQSVRGHYIHVKNKKKKKKEKLWTNDH